MSQSVIGALRVNLGLDSAKFERGARRVNSPLADMKKQFLAVAAVAAAAGAAITAAALAGARDIDKAAKAARRLDASIGGFRALELAADEAGVNLSSLTNDIQTMNREIASIGTTGNGKRALDSLGLSIDDLAGKDADERLAIIADQVKALGLSSGQTTAILRDLGVRNREMVLLVAQGGDVIRKARQDMVDYGLAGQSVDDMAPAMERANDAMSRLGFIGRYLRQELARELVPAMGRFAESMTDSLRSGGLLRGVIDGLAANIKRVGTYLAVAVAGFGVRYVAALAAAKLATLSLSGSLLVLRGALIKSGIGAIIVGAGELVYQFSKLVTGAGGFGNALGLLKDVAVEVWQRISDGVAIIPAAVRAGSAKMYEWFVMAVRDMTSAFTDFTWKIAEGLNSLFGTNLTGLGSGLNDGLWEIEKTATLASANAAKAMAGLAGSFSAPLETIAALRAAMSGATNETDGAGEAADRFNTALDDVESSGGGAAGGVSKVKGAVSELAKGLKSMKSSAQSAFAGLVTGAKSAKEALSDVLGSLATMFANQAFNSLFSPIFGSIPGFAKGTNYAPGGMALVGEEGPELINLPRGSQVIPNNEIGGMNGGSDTYNFAPSFQMTGSGDDVDQLKAAFAKFSAEFESRFISTFTKVKKQRKITT
jgi:hypothetical protein